MVHRLLTAGHGLDVVVGVAGAGKVVEGAIALLHWFRRLRIRGEIRDDIRHAFLTLGCGGICWRRLRTALCRE
ncbi:hypothetical protein [Streptomyces sp. NPDC020983]|uniref:hypothetical protein n=1 Tax=Streptomyces sp. NPDC020983 TaxID=3365106 RepID=UPI0037AEFD7D